MKCIIAHFSYKVKSFILFCNLLALTFFKSFFFSMKGLSLSEDLGVFLKRFDVLGKTPWRFD